MTKSHTNTVWPRPGWRGVGGYGGRQTRLLHCDAIKPSGIKVWRAIWVHWIYAYITVFGGIAVSFSTCFGLDQALHIYTHIGLLVAVITVVCHTEGPCWITRLKTPRADCVESGNPLIARSPFTVKAFYPHYHVSHMHLPCFLSYFLHAVAFAILRGCSTFLQMPRGNASINAL